MLDATVIAERAFVLDPAGDGHRDMDQWAGEWCAYEQQPEHLRQALYGYRARAGVELPAAVSVAVHKRKVRAEHRTYDVGVVIVREATNA